MAYGKDFAGSARRHLSSGKLLQYDVQAGSKPGSKAVAGYLFGLAGELALKHLMWQSGMRQLPPEERREDPFYAHFPALKTLLCRNVRMIRDAKIRVLAEQRTLFVNWDTTMRYAPTNDIDPDSVAVWQEQAEELVNELV